nr:RNA-directed DNA polymerase, eukaryota [Tanacetum cinerariifolium]
MVPDTIFSPIQEEPKHGNKSNFEEGEIQSEDPFHIYDLLVKKPKNDNKEEKSSKATLKYPLGFTPDDVLRTKDVQDVDDVVEVQENTQKSQFKRSVGLQTGGSILQVMEDLVKVGQTMGYRMEGGILCAWDPMMFHKHNAMISNYFVAIQGEWIANAKKYLVISVYAPQEASEKRMLWSYLNHMIERFIVDTWSNMSISDTNAISKFMKKLRHLKLQTRLWIRDRKKSATTKKAQLKGMLKDIDILIDKKKVDHELLNKRMNVINSIHDLEKLEATEIAQKAKIKWSIEGDENSKFFHGILNKKRNQHAIRDILSEGNWIEDPNSVKNEFFSHFKKRFDSPCSSRLMLEGEFLNKLSADQSIDLESNVTIEEIKRAVWDCGIDKSPGPDGFTFGFYRRYLDIIKKDVVDAVSFFFISCNFPKGGNSSFIALIPKMQDAIVVKDYRPISLIGNGPFILEELIHWCHARKKETMIFKVDFEKAYDSVKWDYLDDVLNKFGFGSKWRNWIHNCLNSSKDSILSLHLSFQNLVNEGHFKRVSVSSSLHLSHLFYADDIIFMGQWSVSNINTLVQALDCFYKDSGLRMNLQKSKLMGISVEDETVSRAASKMGCCTLTTPFLYLGVKVSGSMSRIKSWDEIEAKLHSDLSKWKMKTLSSGGEFLNKLRADQSIDLESNVTIEEIKRAVWDCGIDKSPGPDGFTFGNFPKCGNSSFIALIPKMKDAKVVKDYRLISLIGSLYKIIAKILANRLASGLRMNLQKSKLMGISVEDEIVSRAASKMGCCTLTTPFLYLGVKVGLSKWKMKTLSSGGRLTLLKSVLGSSPIYYMSIYKVPSKVLKCLKDIRRNFFIGADVKEKKMSWFKWSRVLASKEKRELAVSGFFALNRALLFKWMWLFSMIKMLYGLGSFEQFMVGNGLNTKFWEDVWMGNKNFKTSFPRIYALESDKNLTVADKMAHNDFAFSLRRQPRDGVEMEQFRALSIVIEGVLLHDMVDR